MGNWEDRQVSEKLDSLMQINDLNRRSGIAASVGNCFYLRNK